MSVQSALNAPKLNTTSSPPDSLVSNNTNDPVNEIILQATVLNTKNHHAIDKTVIKDDNHDVEV